MDDNKNKPNTEQMAAIEHGDGPLLIVAGAGTGKTTVITERIAYLINSGKAKPDEILALTFTDKAALEMEERVDRLMPYGYVDLWIMTFHAFGERILKQYGLDIGLPTNFKLLGQTDQWLMVRKNLDKFNLDYYRPLGNPTKFIHAMINHFSRCKDELIEPKDYLAYAEKLDLSKDDVFTGINYDTAEAKALEIKRINELSDGFHVYQNLLLINSSLDFGDLINYTLKLFRARPAILNKFKNQFKYILVDEFQDTNYAQYELIKLLAGDKANITVVGDDDQAIYAFRGASMSNILNFKKDYPEAKEIFLVENYRSCQEILDLSYAFIQQNNPNRLEEQLSINKQRKLSKKLKSHLTEPVIINHLHAEDLDGEVDLVVKKIIELKNTDQEATWNDFAILIRANDTSLPFIAGLDVCQVPYIYLASKGLYTKPVVLDIISYLKLLDNYHEGTAVYRVLNIPFFKINHHDLIKIIYLSRRKAWSMYSAMKYIVNTKEIADDSRAAINKILAMIDKHSAMVKNSSVGSIVLEFLEESGYSKYVSHEDSTEKREMARYLNQFYHEIKDFEAANVDKSIRSFIENLDYILESGEQGSLTPDFEGGPEAVKVMTVHGAKGLEFKYVFVVSLVDKKFPTIERKEPIEIPLELVKEILPAGDIHLEEERRLFYVAMTRAKKGLYFSSAESYGGVRKKKLSRFLGELGFVSQSSVPIPISNGMGAERSGIKNISKYKQKIPKTNGQIKFELPKKFSFSQLRDFKSCPYKYRFGHILGIPTKGKAVFSFGTTIHSTLQKFFELARERRGSAQADLFSRNNNHDKKIRELVSLDECLKIYDNSWIDDWYEDNTQKEKYKKKGMAAIKNFYNNLFDDQTLPIKLEQVFNIKIGKHVITGRIDRIDQLSANEIEIIDYKTGNAKDKLAKDDKEQLLLYQMAAEDLFKLKPKKLTYYYLEEDKQQSFIGSGDDLLELEQNILATIEELKTSDFTPTPSMMCRYCDYSGICEFRQNN